MRVAKTIELDEQTVRELRVLARGRRQIRRVRQGQWSHPSPRRDHVLRCGLGAREVVIHRIEEVLHVGASRARVLGLRARRSLSRCRNR